ncbi:tRNA (guanine(10)-N2)-methyltransferase like protein [Turdus rufiventris]|nr:tRNA (guanine(10)-N2)-methyltransferase like protein [Turdus rufiventris]
MALAAPALRRYLLLLAQEHLEFRLPEITSLLSLYGGQFCGEQEIRVNLPYLQSDSTYKVHIHTFNKTLTQAQKIQKIDALEFLPFKGKVNLKNPEHIFWILEDYGMNPNDVPEEPIHLYFGRWIADGQRELIESYSVKKRHFIGNTSMDACLSFIMANHGRVKPNDIVYDPFVGTGGLLISSAHFGAYVCGTDIDYNTIHGLGKASRKNQKWRGPDENIRANLRQYGLEKYYLDALVADSSRPIWRKGMLFDAIITDRLPLHEPTALRMIISSRYTEEIIPRHPCLKLISNCEQMLSSHTSRRLITMEKVKEFKDQDENSYLLDGQYMPYRGHNSFREKYFSGVTKRIAKEEKDNQK